MGWRGLALAILLLPVALVTRAVEGGVSCRDIRLDAPGGSMEHVPVFYQGNLGVCYSAAASQLVDAFRFSHEQSGDRNYEHRTSTLEAAAGLRDVTNSQKKFEQGGKVCDVVPYLKEYGSCHVDELERVFTSFNTEPVIKAFRTLHQEVSEFRRAHPKITGIAELLFQLEYKINEFYSVMRSKTLRTDLLPRRHELVQILKHDSEAKAVHRFLTFFCERKPRQPISSKIECVNKTYWSTRDAVNEIHRLLSQPDNPQPIEAGVCTTLFTNGPEYKGFGAFRKMKKDCQPHSVLVIGRRMHRGECQFLVRNSWGKYCHMYHSDFECEDGNVWVNAEDLIGNIDGITFLSEKRQKRKK